MDFRLKNTNPWDVLHIADGTELAVGTAVFTGPRKMLVGGVEQDVCEQCYGGEYNLENGKIVTVVDGVITEIKDAPAGASMKADADERAKKYRKKN